MGSFNKEEKWKSLAYLSRKCRESGGRKWEREREKRSVSSSTLKGTVAPFAEMGFERAVVPFADICEKRHLDICMGI